MLMNIEQSLVRTINMFHEAIWLESLNSFPQKLSSQGDAYGLHLLFRFSFGVVLQTIQSNFIAQQAQVVSRLTRVFILSSYHRVKCTYITRVPQRRSSSI